MRHYPVRVPSAEWRYEQPLVDIARETWPLEWSAAMYESYAADHEYLAMQDRHGTATPETAAADRYAHTAQALVEDLEHAARNDAT